MMTLTVEVMEMDMQLVNSTCNIRTTLIAGDFDKRGYQDGYNAGYSVGSSDCRTDRANGRVR